jgi:hypothetical protein
MYLLFIHLQLLTAILQEKCLIGEALHKDLDLLRCYIDYTVNVNHVRDFIADDKEITEFLHCSVSVEVVEGRKTFEELLELPLHRLAKYQGK